MSGGYEDDVDKLEELIYTGQGGNDLKGDRRQYRDQRVLDKSNLSLKVSDFYVSNRKYYEDYFLLPTQKGYVCLTQLVSVDDVKSFMNSILD